MPPRARPAGAARHPPAASASVGALLNRAQDTASAAAHGKLAPHLWAHLAAKGADAFWEELCGCVDYLLTIPPVRGDGNVCVWRGCVGVAELRVDGGGGRCAQCSTGVFWFSSRAPGRPAPLGTRRSPS
jgi:hypothetical protein